MRSLRRFWLEREGLATIEYVIGAAVVLGTLVAGGSAWNNGLVARRREIVGAVVSSCGPVPCVTRMGKLYAHVEHQ